MIYNALLSNRSRRSILVSGILLLVVGASGLTPARTYAGSPAPDRGSATGDARGRAAARFGALPMRFEANRGQTDGRVKFVARGDGYNLFLTPEEAVLGFPNAPAVRLRPAGASRSVSVEGEEALPGVSNYLRGDDASAWRTSVPGYAKVRYRGVYDGVDLVFYGNEQQLEFDFVVSPGVDPRVIRLAYDGASHVRIAGDGALILQTPGGELRQEAPVVYQQAAGGRRPVAGGYRLTPGGEVGFEVGLYDRSEPLVIDPVLNYSTYLGGTGADSGRAIVVDGLGNAYVTGSTASLDFPTPAPIQGSGGGEDVFVAKLNAAGTALVYSTYLGGSGAESGAGLALGANGNLYVIGDTTSTDFPTLNPLQAANGGGRDVFVAILNATGSAVAYSTYLGGAGDDFGADLALDASGNIYVTGRTASLNFPTLNPLQTDSGDNADDAFATKMNAAGSSLVYSTYLAGNGIDAGRGIAVNAAGEAYILGDTTSSTFATRGAIQNALSGPRDVFLVRLNASATDLVTSTYFGGTGEEFAGGIAIDGTDNVYLTGATTSTDFPTMNPIRLASGGGPDDAFVTKLGAGGTTIVYSTYLGGNKSDAGRAIVAEANGAVYVVGDTSSTDFPSVQPIQTNPGDQNRDVFVTRVNAAGTAFSFSTYLGGDGRDEGQDVAVDQSGNVYVTGLTRSGNFPTQSPVMLNPDGDTPDAFVTRIVNSTVDVAISKTGTPDPVPSGSQVTYTITVSNAGPETAGNVVVTDATPAGTTFASASASQGTNTAPAAGATGDVTFAIGAIPPGGTATATVVLTVTAAQGAAVTNTATVTTTALDTNAANNSASVTTAVSAPVTPPTITSAERFTNPFRIKISGDNFQPGVQVFIGSDTTPWPTVTYKSVTRITLKGGAALKAKFPKGVPVQIRVVNPDGGQAITTLTR